MATVRQLITQLGFSVNESGLKRYEKSTDNIRQKAEGAANSFRNMFAAFAGVAAVRSLANIADSMQSLQARISLLPQTVGDASQTFDEVSKRATAARTSVEAYGTLYVRLASATKDFITDQNQVLQVTDSISAAMVVGGATAQEAASAMLQLSQGFQKGKLDGDEFRAFMETMSSGVKDMLARELGQESSAALLELSRSGKLTAEALAGAFQRIGPEIQQQMLQIPITIGQATTIIGNRWATFIHRLNRESGAVTDITAFMLGGWDAVESAIYKVIDALGGAQNAVKVLGIVIGAALAPWLTGAMLGAVAALLSPITLLVAGLALIGLIAEDIYQWFNGNNSLLGDLIGHVSAWGVEVQAIKSYFDDVATVVSWIYDNVIKPVAETGFNLWISQLKIVWEVVKGIFGVLKGVAGIVNTTIDFFQGETSPAQVTNRRPNEVALQQWGNMAAGGAGTTNNTTINVTAAPGTPEANKEAARAGVKQAMDEGAGARKRGQAL